MRSLFVQTRVFFSFFSSVIRILNQGLKCLLIKHKSIFINLKKYFMIRFGKYFSGKKGIALIKNQIFQKTCMIQFQNNHFKNYTVKATFLLRTCTVPHRTEPSSERTHVHCSSASKNKNSTFTVYSILKTTMVGFGCQTLNFPKII